MSIPPSLKKVEEEITKDLKKANLRVYFKVDCIRPNRSVAYSAGSYDDPTKPIPPEANSIIQKHIEKWQKESFKEF